MISDLEVSDADVQEFYEFMDDLEEVIENE